MMKEMTGSGRQFPENGVKDCTQCQALACREYLSKGMVPYYGSTLCRPEPKE